MIQHIYEDIEEFWAVTNETNLKCFPRRYFRSYCFL